MLIWVNHHLPSIVLYSNKPMQLRDRTWGSTVPGCLATSLALRKEPGGSHSLPLSYLQPWQTQPGAGNATSGIPEAWPLPMWFFSTSSAPLPMNVQWRGNHEYSLEGLMLKLKIQYFVHLIQRADSLEKTLMLGKQKEKGAAEDEMVEWHHQLTGRVFGQTLGISEGQGSLACCSPWGSKESDMTEWLNNMSAHLPARITSWTCCWQAGSFRDSQAILPMPGFRCGEKGRMLSDPSTSILVWRFRQCHRQPASSHSTSYWLEMTWARHLPPGSSASLSLNREYLAPTQARSI